MEVVHVATVFEGSGHDVAQVPQCVGALVKSVSQPSAACALQSPQLALHVKPHCPLAHVGCACAGTGHAPVHDPHVVGVFRSVSQPSVASPLQSPQPASQA